MIIEFVAYMKPMALKRPRLMSNKIVYDPSKKDKQKWIEIVKKHIPKKPLLKPLSVQLDMYFQRPKSHYRSGKYSKLLKSSCPLYNITMPDIDNCAKFILDAMNHIFYDDDRQVCQLICNKHYIDRHLLAEKTPKCEGYTIVKMIECPDMECDIDPSVEVEERLQNIKTIQIKNKIPDENETNSSEDSYPF